MNQKEVVDIIDDRISQRFESFAQTMNALHKDSHDKIIIAVENKMDAKFNGKVDGIKKDMDEIRMYLKSLDERVKPFEDGVSWFTKTKNGVGWLAGFITPIAIVGGAIIFLIDLIKK